MAVGLLVLMAWTCSARAGAIVEGDPTDAMVDQTAVDDGAFDTIYDFPIGALYGTNTGVQVEAFALPYLAPGQQVTGASISFYLESYNTQGAAKPTYNLALYGLNRVSATSPLPLTSDWYLGANDSANTLLAPTFITPSTPVASTASYSGSNLVSFIQKQYTNSAFSGMDLSKTRYVFFRLNADGTQNGYNNYIMGNSRNPNRTYHPVLTLTFSNGISNVAGRLQFSFNLPQAADTSAGVYNTSTGALIRTIWNNVQYPAGTSYGVWDGNDDNGNPVATGTSYQIKMIYHNVAYVWEGMIGNTSASQTGANVYHSFQPMQDMAIVGTQAFYSVGYNEGQDPFHQFTVGAPQVPSEINPGFNDCFSNFTYLAADGTKSYWAKGNGGISPSDTYVIAINNSNGTVYTFPKGTVPSGSNQSYLYTSCVDFDATANQPNPATGLAVQQSGNALFVSHGNLNVVRVFDKVQGNLLGTIAVTNPGRMATTANGDVWIISGGTTPSVSRYTFANGSATLKQTLTGLVNPQALGVSADDSLLLVADAGTSNQIKAYTNATGVPAWTYGTLGGMPVNGPNVTTNCFDFTNSSFFAFQTDGTFWVRDSGNGRILHYSISNGTLTYLEQIAYLGASYKSTVDLTDATRVFNQFYEYSVNYSLPVGGTNGSWTMTKNWVYGLPNDSTHTYIGFANGFNNVVTLSNGRTYALLNNSATGRISMNYPPADRRGTPVIVTGISRASTRMERSAPM